MATAVDLAQPGIGNVEVALGGGQAGVPQEGLDHPKVRSAIEQVGSERVAERVRVGGIC